MKFYGIDSKGEVRIERCSQLPSTEEGARLVYSSENDDIYFGKGDSWQPLSRLNIGENGVSGISGTSGLSYLSGISGTSGTSGSSGMIVETWGENASNDYNNRTEDSEIWEKNATTNYGTRVYLMTGASGTNEKRRSLIRFTPKQDIPGATITWAKIWCNFYSNLGNHNVSVYRVLQNWVESQTTWNIYATGSNWHTAGCASASDSGVDDDASYDRHATPIDTVSITGSGVYNVEWKSFDVTSIVQGWVNGTIKEYGLLLQSDNEPGSVEYASIRSSENTEDATERLYLEIQYG